MISEQELISKYEAEIPMFEAWGDFVNTNILKALKANIPVESDFDTFLKIPPIPRIKGKKELVGKAFYRGKNYEDPYSEISDKVGVRYVVLLRENIEFVCKAVQSFSELWDYSKDRDFEEERDASPLVFDYQSVHFIVKNKEPLKLRDLTVPASTPCEVQVRTLLQHACSELTHNTTYKPQTRVTPRILRCVAKSRALTEAADDLFVQVNGIIKLESGKINSMLRGLLALYSSLSIPEYEEKVNSFLLDAFAEIIDGVNMSAVEAFVAQRAYIRELIKKRHESFLFRQPIVLLLYYLVSNRPSDCRRLWPLPPSQLEPFFTDMGIASDPL